MNWVRRGVVGAMCVGGGEGPGVHVSYPDL